MPRKPNNLVGQRFGKLTVIKDTGKRKRQYPMWLCQCDCGNTHEVDSDSLTRNQTRSCGCLRERPSSAPDDYKTKLYARWQCIKGRCNNNSDTYYAEVEICDEWSNDFFAFKEWALNNGWDDSLDLDIHRINNAPIYSPETCEFLNSSEHTKLHWCIYRENKKK